MPPDCMNREYDESLELLGSFQSKSSVTEINDDDLGLKNADYEAIINHTKIYSDYLEAYVLDYQKKSKAQRRMKHCFFWIIIALLVLIAAVGSCATVFICKKEVISIPDVAAIITAIAGSVTSFLVLPKIIAENLFPSKEEDRTAEIFGKMFEHDINIRGIYRPYQGLKYPMEEESPTEIL